MTIKLNKTEFEFFVSRSYDPIDIYKSDNSFLHIGRPDLIEREIQAFRDFSESGFPVAKLISDGVFEDRRFFITQSVGDHHFGDLFADDMRQNGFITPNLFDKWLLFTAKYTEVQFGTVRHGIKFDDFAKIIHLQTLYEELPSCHDLFDKSMTKIKSKLSSSTFVLSHNDFNSHNIFPAGVIDMERVGYSPSGYDLVTNLFHIYLHPKDQSFEFYRHYEFSKQQIDKYLKTFPSIKGCLNELLVCRAIWSSTQMQRWPKIQAWRHERLIKMMNDFISGNSLMWITEEE